jgi:hypothetical protein
MQISSPKNFYLKGYAREQYKSYIRILSNNLNY